MMRSMKGVVLRVAQGLGAASRSDEVDAWSSAWGNIAPHSGFVVRDNGGHHDGVGVSMDNTSSSWQQDACDAGELDTLSLFGVADGTETINEAAAGGGGGGSDGSSQRSASSRYRPAKRHTAEQIRHLEAVFRRCSHPDEKVRAELAEMLDMEERQVKFWFQNRRTQRKVHCERRHGVELQLENERLNAENKAMREAMLDKICFRCGGPVGPAAAAAKDTPEKRRLRSENAKLADELLRATAVLAQVTTQDEEGPQYGGAFNNVVVDDDIGAGLLVGPPTPLPSVYSSSP
ncbi:hypothetical protein GUJ93_ZPchr0008g11974 [Zizania palustris]|uniref:Homeobox domain-containing protein n=1 Tax=Zizania palustris TaxID=103762 RepID=A0A8J5QYW0_ZIZPA|nr:hypothetical protein GUJ93_ZPchr0008g11974 [Zizania palustris]